MLHSGHFKVYNCNDFDFLIPCSSALIADILSSSDLIVIQRVGCVKGFPSEYQFLSLTNVAVLTFVIEYNHNAWCEGVLLPKLTFEKV